MRFSFQVSLLVLVLMVAIIPGIVMVGCHKKGMAGAVSYREDSFLSVADDNIIFIDGFWAMTFPQSTTEGWESRYARAAAAYESQNFFGNPE